jgi:3-hydroxyacyl-[acyl-carrier-protein] dehydratase
VPQREFIVDLAELKFDPPLAGIDEIRRFNPQRHEMEQLTGVLFEDLRDHRCAAYKDVTHNEFWCRGHMPGMPLMPGVVMLEAIAQMCSYFAQKYDLLGAQMVGLGGFDGVRFRDPVIPGDRLIVMCQLIKARRNQIILCKFQGIVRQSLVVEGELKGIPIPVEALSQRV